MVKDLKVVLTMLESVIESLPFKRKVVNKDGSEELIIISELTFKEQCNLARIRLNVWNVDIWEAIRTSLFDEILEMYLQKENINVIGVDTIDKDFIIKKCG